MKVCSKCGEIKKEEEFINSITCKSCAYKKKNIYRRNTPPKEYRFNHGKPWTKEDQEYIANFYHLSNEELAYALGRSVGAIGQKKSELKRKGIEWRRE